MKLAVASLLLAVPALTGCGALTGDDSAAQDGKLQVAAAFYPLQFAAQRVAGPHADVVNLTQPGGEPHDVELTVRETAVVTEADVVIFEHGFQPAVDAAVEQNAQGEVVNVEEAVDLLPLQEGAPDDPGSAEPADEHGDEHGAAVDPHFWLDPVRMADLGDEVAAALAKVDPDRASDYQANAEALRADLTSLDEEYSSGLEGCKRDTVVVSHDAFGYLAKYGLRLEPIAGLSPDAEPTPADLARLQELIDRDGITTVFAETLVSKKLAETLANDTGVATDVLDPIEGLSDTTAEEDYLSLMRSNLAALQKANGC